MDLAKCCNLPPVGDSDLESCNAESAGEEKWAQRVVSVQFQFMRFNSDKN